MKRLYAFLIAAALCLPSFGAVAWWHSIQQVGVSTGGCSDSNATAWAAAVVTAGGTVSGTQQTRVCNLIVALKSHSLWTIQDRIWLHAGESDAHQATIDIVNLGVATPNGSLTLANGGYTGDGSTGYLDTGYSGLTNGVNYTNNSASVSTYDRTLGTSSSGVLVGFFDGASTGSQSIVWPYDSGQIDYDVNNAQFTAQATNANSQGFYTSVRTGSAVQAVYQNSSAAALATNTTSSTGLASVNFFILARNVNGTPAQFSSNQTAITTIGAGMSGSQTSTFQTDINNYMKALPGSLNVY